ncbi:Tetratricopeptide TPR_2 (possibly involved in Mn /Fe reduction) [Sulfurimonas gotlandica GD1]|uniref:Tetratricopeptide TPR_2 (Possibly involved in Mn /Fe reduction) n=1 Tax=Sulfurimonas gotlandica (strain DSM 19862 / JCM 16533 / GD1) TaxID=929558 RepID=B6BK24_SULGG|nr:multiheme c-type cytochrome [Sulfurimonas gotlandica]EDZ62670.1 cytochrome C family protein [Sulfurimonas gotlandica GD1]EHP31115.1 Tetratricopeptide TPR_2 (possibly involved in Mn /Fe reduction) [Sulfurimonas gotlandica GD1]
MNKRTIAIITILPLIAFLAYRFNYVHSDVDESPSYVGSDNCKSCHQTHYESWKHNTLHPLIFLPITDLSQIVGDFEQNNPLVTFKKEEITHVVGSKWEQVYMRVIDGEYYPFTAKWMITAQKWVPYKVHKWKETPASTKCNGCHTTGYDAKTYNFSEFGVACEACHGGGSLHVKHQNMVVDTECVACHRKPHVGEADIVVSTKSTVCGQCHSRGQSVRKDLDGKTTSFNFPLEYKPGNNISDTFVASTINNDKKGKNWWCNGVSKNRHQEFADFSFSKHANSLDDLRQKKNPHGGEKNDDCLKCHSQDYRSAKKDEKPTLKTAKHGLTCVTCHEPHGIDRNIKGNAGPNKCGECHLNTYATLDHKNNNKRAEIHFPCPVDKVSCADCHMPRIVKTGGDFTIRSHAFRIIPPSASIKYEMPNSCQNSGCHADKSHEEMSRIFHKSYPNYQLKSIKEVLKEGKKK